jgi:hypothetical protein
MVAAMTESRLTLTDFKALCRAELEFLVTDLGFQECPPDSSQSSNPFQVQFIRDDLTVTVKGIHWGDAAMLYIRDKAGRRIIPEYLDPTFTLLPIKLVSSKHSPGQAEEIRRDASKLRTLGKELLQGDFTAFESAIARSEVKLDPEYQARRLRDIAVQEAVAAYRLQQWPRVIELLEPFEDTLSKRMARKLAEARERLTGDV